MKDTEPGGKLYDAAMQAGAAVARKLTEADGPVSFDADEAGALKVIMLGLQKQLHIAQETNLVVGAALYRKHLTIVHHKNDDGTFTVDLAEKPPDAPATIN